MPEAVEIPLGANRSDMHSQYPHAFGALDPEPKNALSIGRAGRLGADGADGGASGAKAGTGKAARSLSACSPLDASHIQRSRSLPPGSAAE